MPFALMAPPILSATELPTISDPVVQGCIEKLMPVNSLTQQIALRSYDDSGLIEESLISLYWWRAEDDKSRASMRLRIQSRYLRIAVQLFWNLTGTVSERLADITSRV